MLSDEKKLKYYLNYVACNDDIFSRVEVVLWFQKRFLNYWAKLDQKNNANNTQILRELYFSNEKKSMSQIASSLGLHVRTLNRYRKKYVDKMHEIMQQAFELMKQKNQG